MLIKTPVLHQSFGPCVLLSLSLSVSVSLSLSGWSPGAQRPSEFTFLLGLLRPSREGALCLHPIERAPEAFVNRASPMSGTLLVFCVNQGISASFSLLYFLIIDSGPPGSGPLKDLNSHVWMWELDYKERWALKNWCFWTVVLEKTREFHWLHGDQTSQS